MLELGPEAFDLCAFSSSFVAAEVCGLDAILSCLLAFVSFLLASRKNWYHWF